MNNSKFYAFLSIIGSSIGIVNQTKDGVGTMRIGFGFKTIGLKTKSGLRFLRVSRRARSVGSQSRPFQVPRDIHSSAVSVLWIRFFFVKPLWIITRRPRSTTEEFLSTGLSLTFSRQLTGTTTCCLCVGHFWNRIWRDGNVVVRGSTIGVVKRRGTLVVIPEKPKTIPCCLCANWKIWMRAQCRCKVVRCLAPMCGLRLD